MSTYVRCDWCRASTENDGVGMDNVWEDFGSQVRAALALTAREAESHGVVHLCDDCKRALTSGIQDAVAAAHSARKAGA